MPYDPRIHHRRTIRQKGYDYFNPGAYCVTLVAWQRQSLFGEINGGEMHLNPAGEVLKKCWLQIPGHLPVCLDAWVIMPNHFHAILVLDSMGKGEASAQAGSEEPYKDGGGCFAPTMPQRPAGTTPGSLGAIIQNFKSITTRKINRIHNAPGAPAWQRNYFEHIIRSEAEWQRIHAYILANPLRWAEDRFYG